MVSEFREEQEAGAKKIQEDWLAWRKMSTDELEKEGGRSEVKLRRTTLDTLPHSPA